MRLAQRQLQDELEKARQAAARFQAAGPAVAADEARILERQLSARDAQLRRVRNELAQLQSERSQWSQRLRQAQADQEGLRRALESAQGDARRLEGELAKTQEARWVLEDAVRSGQSDRQVYEALKQRYAQAQERIAELVVALDVQERLSQEWARQFSSEDR